MRRLHHWLLYGIVAAVLAVTMLAPLGMIIGGGFVAGGRFTLAPVLEVFRNPIYAEGLRNSLGIALLTTLTATLIAVPLAWLHQRHTFPGRGALGTLLLLPMILPPFVGAIGFQQIFGVQGALNAALGLGPVDWLGRYRLGGVVLLQALSLYPVLFLNVSAALANVDPSMTEAAENLGSRGLHTFFRITLPLVMPGVFAGASIVFIWSFTELGTPLLLGFTRCAPVQVFDALKEVGSDPFPSALVFVVLVASLMFYAIGRRVLGGRAHAMAGRAVASSAARPLRGLRAAAAILPFVVVLILALAPHVGVILTSLSAPGSWYQSVLPATFTTAHYRGALADPLAIGSIRNSLIYAGGATLLNLVLGVTVAWLVVRARLPGRRLLDALAMLPLAVPGLVLAFGYVALSARLANLPWVRESAFWTAVFDVRVNPLFFLVLAYAVRRLPYLVRSAAAGFEQTPTVFEEAAASLGARPVTTLRRITLPLVTGHVIAGALLVFAFSMLEVSDSLLLAQRMDFYPITKAIYELFQLVGDGLYLASALGVWAMVLLAVALAGAGLLLGRKLGALFRV